MGLLLEMKGDVCESHVSSSYQPNFPTLTHFYNPHTKDSNLPNDKVLEYVVTCAIYLLVPATQPAHVQQPQQHVEQQNLYQQFSYIFRS